MGRSLRILSVMAVALFAMACSGAKETVFDQFGVSFVCPPEWSVSEAVDLDEAIYIAVEEDGSKSGGIITFSILNDHIELDECIVYMNEYFSEMDEFLELNIEEEEEGVYSHYPAMIQDYTILFGEFEVQGRLVAFHTGGSTVCLLEQAYLEDYAKIRKGAFWRVEETFSLNEYY